MPPEWVWPIVAGGVSVITAILRLIRYRMRLKFCERVYETRKDRKDLAVAGRITAPGWAAIALRNKVSERDIDVPDRESAERRRGQVKRIASSADEDFDESSA